MNTEPDPKPKKSMHQTHSHHDDIADGPEPSPDDFDECFDVELIREQELLMHDLVSDNDDYARSEEDGWYYSDED